MIDSVTGYSEDLPFSSPKALSPSPTMLQEARLCGLHLWAPCSLASCWVQPMGSPDWRSEGAGSKSQAVYSPGLFPGGLPQADCVPYLKFPAHFKIGFLLKLSFQIRNPFLLPFRHNSAFLFFFFGHTCSMWKFPWPGIQPAPTAWTHAPAGTTPVPYPAALQGNSCRRAFQCWTTKLSFDSFLALNSSQIILF